MREQHTDPEALTRFLLGEMSDVEAAEIDRHLSVCAGCRDRADETMDLMSLPFFDGGGSAYDDAFDRALVGVAERLSGLGGEMRSAEDLLAELLRSPAPGRQRRIREDERFHSLKLCQLLRSHGKAHWFSNPAAARDAAELAVGVAECLDPGRYGAILTADARALSWAYLGNACRIASDSWRAEGALRRAWSHHRQGQGELDTEGELLVITSSLRILQNRFDAALQYADQAIAVYRSLGDGQREGATLIKKGMAMAGSGRFQAAIMETRAGLLRIGAASDPRLLLIGKQNLGWDLLESGEHAEAGRLLPELRSLGHDCADNTLQARIDWLEGSFASHLGRFGEAERRLGETRDFFLRHESGVDVVLISLHLAEVLARAGKPRRVREILDEVIPLGEAMGLERDILAARLLYAQASGR